MDTKRKPISNKIRFEVFKRDLFTCQYCGGKSPNCLLRVDHINPIKNGGDNNIINLITSCFECNSGKGATLLSDQSSIEVQRQQLEELNERRQQLEMMVQWREELLSFEQDSVDVYVKKINEKLQPWFHVNDQFKLRLRKIVKESTPVAIFDAIEESFSRHIQYDDEGGITEYSALLFIDKIKGIARFKSLPPKDKKITWLLLRCKNKYKYDYDFGIKMHLNRYWDSLINDGLSEDDALDNLQTEILGLIYHHNNLEGLIENIQDWTNYYMSKN